MEAENTNFTEKQKHHRKELEQLLKRCEEVDKQLHTGGMSHLQTVKQCSESLSSCAFHMSVMGIVCS